MLYSMLRKMVPTQDVHSNNLQEILVPVDVMMFQSHSRKVSSDDVLWCIARVKVQEIIKGKINL